MSFFLSDKYAQGKKVRRALLGSFWISCANWKIDGEDAFTPAMQMQALNLILFQLEWMFTEQYYTCCRCTIGVLYNKHRYLHQSLINSSRFG